MRLAVLAIVLGLAAPAAAGPKLEDVPCPEAFRGSVLRAADVDGGVTLQFTTREAAHVDKLRELVRGMARIVEEHVRGPLEPDPDPDEALPPMHLRVTDLPTGALVTVVPDDVRDLPVVRAQARVVERFWAKWPCTSDYMLPVTIFVRTRSAHTGAWSERPWSITPAPIARNAVSS